MLQFNAPKVRAGIERSNTSRADRSKDRPAHLKHGAWAQAVVLPGEDPHEFDHLQRGLIREWRPCGPAEQDAVLTLAKCMWRKRRVERLREEVVDEARMRMISAVRAMLLHG